MPRGHKCQLSEAPPPQEPELAFRSPPEGPKGPTTSEVVSLGFSPKEHGACLPGGAPADVCKC